MVDISLLNAGGNAVQADGFTEFYQPFYQIPGAFNVTGFSHKAMGYANGFNLQLAEFLQRQALVADIVHQQPAAKFNQATELQFQRRIQFWQNLSMQAKHKGPRFYAVYLSNILELLNKCRVAQLPQAEDEKDALLVLPDSLAAPQIDLFAHLLDQG